MRAVRGLRDAAGESIPQLAFGWVIAIGVVLASVPIVIQFLPPYVELAWWHKALLGAGAFALFLIAFIAAVLGWDALEERRHTRQGEARGRRLREVLAHVQAGRVDEARAFLVHAANWANHEPYDEVFKSEQQLLLEYAAAARREGELRPPLLRFLLMYGPRHADLVALFSDSVDAMEPRDLRDWLYWLSKEPLHAPEETVAAAAERAFARMDSESRQDFFRLLFNKSCGEIWRPLARQYADDLRALEGKNLSEWEQGRLGKFRALL
jgi:hypothetical protein